MSPSLRHQRHSEDAQQNFSNADFPQNFETFIIQIHIQSCLSPCSPLCVAATSVTVVWCETIARRGMFYHPPYMCTCACSLVDVCENKQIGDPRGQTLLHTILMDKKLQTLLSDG